MEFFSLLAHEIAAWKPMIEDYEIDIESVTAP